MAISADQAMLWAWANSKWLELAFVRKLFGSVDDDFRTEQEREGILRAAKGTEAGTTASSKTGSLKEAMSTMDKSILEEDEDSSASRTEETNLVTEGPMRTARVLPVMMAIFLGATRLLIFAASAILNAVR